MSGPCGRTARQAARRHSESGEYSGLKPASGRKFRLFAARFRRHARHPCGRRRRRHLPHRRPARRRQQHGRRLGLLRQRRVPRLAQGGRRADHGRQGGRRPPVRHERQEHLDLRHLDARVPAAARLAGGEHLVGERGGADERQGPRVRERLLQRHAELRRRARRDGMRPVLRRARSVEYPGGRLTSRSPTTPPNARSTASSSTAARAPSSTPGASSTARPPTVIGDWIDGARGAGRRLRAAAITSARSAPACC